LILEGFDIHLEFTELRVAVEFGDLVLVAIHIGVHEVQVGAIAVGVRVVGVLLEGVVYG